VKRLATPLLGLALFLMNVWLNWPLFMPGDLPFPGSIERGYVGMARFVAEQPNPWGWNPLPYCGLPTQFMYVPGLPYVSALFIRLLPHASPDTIYRIIVSLATCLGPVTLFLFAVYFTRSRKWAFATALAYSLISPSYALFPAVETDRGFAQLPWRIQVLAKYGEGPHNTALTMLPLALLALWRAAKGRTYKRIFAAAVLLAAIPLFNWVGAMGLAISSALLLIAAFGEIDFAAWRAFAAAGLAYLLACFWLTPSFVRTIAFNWPADSFAYQFHAAQAGLLLAVAAGVAAIRVLFRYFHGSFYFSLVTMGAWVFGFIATVFYVFGVDTIPESRRYAIEFELFAALAIVEALRLALRSANSTVRLCAIGSAGLMLLVGSPQLWAYLTQGWQVWMPHPTESTVEYRLADWIAAHPPEGRVFASGGLRFRLNSWFDLQQVGGPFETGLQNRIPVELAYRIRSSDKADESKVMLLALGAQYVVVHGPKSREYYRDFRNPERLAGMPVAYRVEDDTIYSPGAHPIAQLMHPIELPAADPRTNAGALNSYAAAITDYRRPQLAVQWNGLSALSVSGPMPADAVVALQINADAGWRATQDGHPVPLTEDRLGFLVVHPTPAAASRIELRYVGTAEQRIFAVLSAAAWALALAALFLKRSQRKTSHG